MHQCPRRTFVFGSSAAIFFSGCANSPPSDSPYFSPAPEAPKGYATLYILRPFLTDIASGVWPVTFFDGIKVADVKVASYTYLYIRPGQYRLTTEKSWALSGLENIPADIHVPSEGEHFLAFLSSGRSSVVTVGTSSMALAGPSSHGWRMLRKEDALVYLPKLRYLAPDRKSFPL